MSTLTYKVTANGALEMLEDILRKRYEELQKEKTALQARNQEINDEIAVLASIRSDIVRKRSA